MELVFGVPKATRLKEEDKYAGQAVLRMYPKPTEKGVSYRFQLSNTAAEKLGFNDTNGQEIGVSFPRNSDEPIMIANVTGKEVPESYRYSKTSNSFSNKPMYTYLEKNLGLDVVDNEVVFEIQNIKESQESSDNFQYFGELHLLEGTQKKEEEEEQDGRAIPRDEAQDMNVDQEPDGELDSNVHITPEEELSTPQDQGTSEMES